MSLLNRYIKPETNAEDTKTTSVSIETKQWEFVKEKKMNLSLITRDAIQKLMEESEKLKLTLAKKE